MKHLEEFSHVWWGDPCAHPYEPSLLGSFGSVAQTFFSSITGTFLWLEKRYHRVEWPFSIIESPREGHLILHLLPRKMMNSFFNMLSFSTTSRYTSVFVICGRLRFFILPRCQMPVSATLTPYFQPLWLRCALHADVLYLQEAGLCWCRWCGWCCCCCGGGGGGRRRLQTAKLTPLFMPLTTLAHGKN